MYGSDKAYFSFENVNLLTNYTKIKQKLLEYKNQTFISYNSTLTVTNYSIITENDKNLVNAVRDMQDLINCLNETIKKNVKLHPKWNNYFGSLVNNREGKSIYNTDLTLSYNQHFAWSIKDGTKRQRVPLEYGYVSHFRDIDLRIIADYSIQNYYFDVELYNFIYDKIEFFD
jgi:hypothetical protein